MARDDADATAVVRTLHEAFMRAAHTGDAKAAQALYADDITVVWEYDGDEARGRTAIDALIARVFGSMTGLTLTLQDVDGTPLGADHITAVGHWEVTYSGDDGTLVVLPLRSTEVLVKQDGVWRYLVQHVSQGLHP